jgi:hypothetical protein
MQSRLLLVPAAICVAGPAYGATVYLTGAEAQAILFPGATFTQDFRVLTDRQMSLIQERSRARLTDRKFRMWKVSTGGWFVIDQVEALNTTDTYAIALDEKGVVTGIEILECMLHYDRVREAAWRAQFKGKKYGDLKRKDEIAVVSGSTRSAEAITAGVRKVLTTFNMLVQQPAP